MVGMGVAMITDLYELRMAASYASRGMTESATFSLFIRRTPPGRGFLVAAGLADALRLLREASFDDADLATLLEAAVKARGARTKFSLLPFFFQKKETRKKKPVQRTNSAL